MEGLHLTPLSLKRLRSRDRQHPQSVGNPTELPTIESKLPVIRWFLIFFIYALGLEGAQESIKPGSPTFEGDLHVN